MNRAFFIKDCSIIAVGRYSGNAVSAYETYKAVAEAIKDAEAWFDSESSELDARFFTTKQDFIDANYMILADCIIPASVIRDVVKTEKTPPQHTPGWWYMVWGRLRLMDAETWSILREYIFDCHRRKPVLGHR